MVSLALLGIGLVISVFAGINTGGSSIGESFGPTVGSGVVSERTAAVLMSVFVFAGGLLVGRHVVKTLGHGFVPSKYFTLPAAIGVLLFTGIGILLGNVRGVSVSTSETAVGAVSGLGAALGVLKWGTVLEVMAWWIVSPVIALWTSSLVGRYFYERIEAALALEEGGRSRLGEVLVVGVACYMGFSSGASNVANAIAPLVGAGVLPMIPAVLLGAAAMSVGGFLIGPRTMETVGVEITDMSLTAALVVELIAATIITLLSWAGIPASLAITAITCVIGLGWGRATRRVPLTVNIGLEEISEEEKRYLREDAVDMFNPATTRRVVLTWFASPTLGFVLSYLVFEAANALGVLTA